MIPADCGQPVDDHTSVYELAWLMSRMDPESEMLTEAIRQAREQAIANVSWIQGNSAHLPRDLGHFTLVTMAVPSIG
jgi:ubiquinone/menaquinone biosynthesis C-methylase UbiE